MTDGSGLRTEGSRLTPYALRLTPNDSVLIAQSSILRKDHGAISALRDYGGEHRRAGLSPHDVGRVGQTGGRPRGHLPPWLARAPRRRLRQPLAGPPGGLGRLRRDAPHVDLLRAGRGGEPAGDHAGIATGLLSPR